MIDDRLDADASDEEATGIQITEIPSGRLMKPTGSIYKTTHQVISAMSDQELQEHILHFKNQVKEAEMNLDFRRVQLSAATQEQETRVTDARRKLRNIKISPAAIKIAVGPSTEPKSAMSAILHRMKADGKTDQEIADLLKKINDLVQGQPK